MLLQSVRATLPNVVFSVSPHEHTKCAGKSFDFNTPTCLPAEQGEAAACCQQCRPKHAGQLQLSKRNKPVFCQCRLRILQMLGFRFGPSDKSLMVLLSPACDGAAAVQTGEYNTSIGLEVATMAHDVLNK
jgi:hypothetical protein